jgi:hypothetical protein
MSKPILKTPPAECDICHGPIGTVFYDFKTKMGPWANGCPECYERYRFFSATGMGKGQKYQRNETTGHYELTKGGFNVE